MKVYHLLLMVFMILSFSNASFAFSPFTCNVIDASGVPYRVDKVIETSHLNTGSYFEFEVCSKRVVVEKTGASEQELRDIKKMVLLAFSLKKSLSFFVKESDERLTEYTLDLSKPISLE